MPPNIRRFLPAILVMFLVLFLLPTLLKKKTTGPNASTRAAQTLDAMSAIDKAQQSYRASHGSYTPHLADLVTAKLAGDLVIGLTVQLDAGSDGKTFVAQVRSDVLSLVRARDGKTLTANKCLVLKSGSGVACPAGSA